MYKLMVVAGPNRGTSYAVQQNEITIGRVPGNVIVLESQKVSKKHCKLTINGDDLVLRDEGSANGTFVNGVLTKEKRISTGDRISVGEFVLELVRPRERIAFENAPAPVVMNFASNVVQFPVRHAPASGTGSRDYSSAAPTVPTDPKDKALYYFDQYVMPFFYDMNFRNEWRVIVVGLFGVFVLANLFISVSPLLQSGRRAAISEVAKRAQVLARQISEKNTPFLAAHAEVKTEIGSIEHEDGVRDAVLTDLESRILAPSAKFNQYLLNGTDAKFAVKMREAFRNGRESGNWAETDSETVTAVEPVKLYNPQIGKNVVVAMAIVSIDSSLATPSLGEIGIAYSETLIMTGVLAILILFVLIRLTLKPFQVLNDDIDKVLKGEMGQVTHEFKFSELKPLWDVINSALQRATRSDASAVGGGSSVPLSDELSGPFKSLGEMAPFGLGFCDGDRKVIHLNGIFEEVTGIRSDSASGQELQQAARDQAFGALCTDLFDRASPGGEGVTDDFEFSGVPYKVHVAAMGSPGTGARGYVISFVKLVTG